ncbi:HNH endonuclease signature motif containing protein [Microbispora triticiradicis]|uniref:HNH endonuclease signature motif containing protein n=1 Tax=Microbispora triticiradicis TaxID=2200763 RepID=UPI00142F1BD6|nr:HNH endonuclease signature motif containing protein [Microbispora fusca]
MAAVGEAARAVALVAVPESAEVCLAEAEELLAARDRITSALAARVGRVHRAGEAKSHGHASTRLWLRSVGGMTIPGAGRLVTMGMELGRLSRVRERFAEGSLAEGIVEAICTATAGLTDEQAMTAEGILLELAGSAGAAEVAKAGRYLRAVLDPDGHESGEQADFDRRFFRVRRRRNGGLEGEFYLPVEAAARLQHLLDVYAKPKAEGDDRTPSVRNADAFITFLENKIATELLVLVNAESLPDDPPADEPSREPAGTDPPGDAADSSADHPTSDPVDTDPSDGPGPDCSGTGTGTGPSPDPDPSGTDPGSGPDPDPGSSGAHPSETGYSDAGFLDASFLDTEPGDDPGPEPGSGYDPVPGPDACAAADCGSDACATRAAATCAGATCAGAADATGESSAADSASDPPPEHGDPPGTHIGESPGGDCPVGDCSAGDYRHAFAPGEAPHGMRGAGSDAPSGAEGSTWPRAGSGAPPGSGDRAWAEGSARLGGDAQVGGAAWSGGSARRGGGVWAGSGVGVNSPPPGVWLRGLPGLILATGHLLPVASVHRLARTSALVRIVMDAGGQVLDMGRKVRLATPAQRRAVFARYATCWVDGCPLPATMCQIDHAEDWCSGGLTDLKLLGPACQFHNRDRYRHPTRYTRRKIGADRWAFTYRNPRTTRLRV